MRNNFLELVSNVELGRSLLFLYRCPLYSSKCQTVRQCHVVLQCYCLKYDKSCGLRVRTYKDSVVWSGCCLCFFCLSGTLSRGVYNPTCGQQFSLPWCTAPSLHAEMFLLTHAIWQQGDSGQGTAFRGLWWLTASLWSSRILPLRLNIGDSLK